MKRAWARVPRGRANERIVSTELFDEPCTRVVRPTRHDHVCRARRQNYATTSVPPPRRKRASVLRRDGAGMAAGFDTIGPRCHDAVEPRTPSTLNKRNRHRSTHQKS